MHDVSSRGIFSGAIRKRTHRTLTRIQQTFPPIDLQKSAIMNKAPHSKFHSETVKFLHTLHAMGIELIGLMQKVGGLSY